jgi:hypothetical protein
VRAATRSNTFTTWVPRLPANRALPPRALLRPLVLVCGLLSQRKVGEAEEAVVSDDAVACRPNVAAGWWPSTRRPSRHPGTDLRPGPEEQIGLRANTTTTSTRSTSQPRASRSPRTVGGQGRTQVTNRRLRACPHTHQPTVDGIEEVRFESPEPDLLRRLSDIRPQHAPKINARGCCHPGAGGSHCNIPHLKPDNQLLINSQAVHRPSLVENSRVTTSSVER